MSVNSNTSNMLDQNFFKDHFDFAPRSKASAKRDFSESVQAALSSGLNSRDLQAILDSVLSGEVNSKEVQ